MKCDCVHVDVCMHRYEIARIIPEPSVELKVFKELTEKICKFRLPQNTEGGN